MTPKAYAYATAAVPAGSTSTATTFDLAQTLSDAMGAGVTLDRYQALQPAVSAALNSPAMGGASRTAAPYRSPAGGHYTNLSQCAFRQGLVPTPTFFVDDPAQLASDHYGFHWRGVVLDRPPRHQLLR